MTKITSGSSVHVLDAGQVRHELTALALELDQFLFRAALASAGIFREQLVQFLQTLERLLDRDEVRQKPAQPAVVDVEHVAAGGFFGDGFLRLALGADKHHRLAHSRLLADIAHRVFEQLEGLLQIDDVDSVPFAENVFLHLRIPALGLVPEVNASFEQFFHGNGWQGVSLFSGFRALVVARCGHKTSRPRRFAVGPKRDFAAKEGGWPKCTSNSSTRALALGELEAGACAVLPVLLALMLTGVAGQDSRAAFSLPRSSALNSRGRAKCRGELRLPGR